MMYPPLKWTERAREIYTPYKMTVEIKSLGFRIVMVDSQPLWALGHHVHEIFPCRKGEGKVVLRNTVL
jgi:hypothetical protein